MTKLEQLHIFLKFHFAPDSEQKRFVWAACSTGPYTEDQVERLCQDLANGDFTLDDYEIKMLRIIAEPGPPRDREWAEKITWAGTNADKEAAHADADRLLVNLVKELGYDESAQAWQSVDKWYA